MSVSDVKNEITKSSSDMVSDRSPPVTMPGRISGRITFVIAFIGLQPRSSAASYVFGFICLSLGSTENST